MSIKGLFSFYAIYLPILLGVATIVTEISRDHIIQNWLTYSIISGIALALPLVVAIIARQKGSFAKTFRLISFTIFRVEIFAYIGLLVLSVYTVQFLINLLIRHFFAGEQIFLNVLVLNVFFLYFFGLVIYGRFQIKQLSAILIRQKGHAEVYLYQNGIIRHIPDPPTFGLLGYSWDDIADITDREFRAYKLKPPIESITTAKLIQVDGSPENIWMIFGDARRQIPDKYTLEFVQSLSRRQIDTVSEEELQQWDEETSLVSILKFR